MHNREHKIKSRLWRLREQAFTQDLHSACWYCPVLHWRLPLPPLLNVECGEGVSAIFSTAQLTHYADVHKVLRNFKENVRHGAAHCNTLSFHAS